MFRRLSKSTRTFLDVVGKLPHATRVAYAVEHGRKPLKADLDMLNIRASSFD